MFLAISPVFKAIIKKKTTKKAFPFGKQSIHLMGYSKCNSHCIYVKKIPVLEIK